MQNTKFYAFTEEKTGYANQLITRVGVNRAGSKIDSETKYYYALWDTGATNSSIMVPSHERIDFEPVSEKLNNEVAQ